MTSPLQRYYFDHNATTPVAQEALEAMLPMLREVYGNASSIHHFGQAARHALDDARRQVADWLGAMPEEIVFTSGGTEADNLAVFGAARNGHVITTAVEHPAVLAAVDECAASTILSVDANGLVDPETVRRDIRPDTKLISVMHVNNELGTIQPIEEIAKIAQESGIPLHSDGVQAVGKLAVNVAGLGVAMYSISGHKIGAPKGVGAQFIRKGTAVKPVQYGGRHERGHRAGTENIPGIVALARAATWMMEQGSAERRRVMELRDRLEQQVLARIPDATINGAGAPRVGNTSNIQFDGINSDALLIALDLKGFAVSSGAACSSGAPEPSHVLLAIGLTKDQARASIRVSLGRSNTVEQVEALAVALEAAVAQLRKLSPTYA